METKHVPERVFLSDSAQIVYPMRIQNLFDFLKDNGWEIEREVEGEHTIWSKYFVISGRCFVWVPLPSVREIDEPIFNYMLSRAFDKIRQCEGLTMLDMVGLVSEKDCDDDEAPQGYEYVLVERGTDSIPSLPKPDNEILGCW